MPPLRWTAPITASTVSERIEALSRPPVVSSPRPSLTCSPSPMARPTSASARALTTAARSLASRPSERSGWRGVERLGDDDAEHGVAEELQPLVGRQAAVLVGVGAVGQGAVEQLGVQHGIPERCSQLGVVSRSVGQRTGRVTGPGDGPRARRTGHSCRRRGAAGAWHRTRGWRRSPASARWSSRPSDGGACCCATSSASGQPWFLLSQFCSVCVEVGQGRPPRVDRRVVCVVGVVGQPRPALGAQAGTVVLAQRLERQCEHHRVPQQRLEVDQVVLQHADLVVLLGEGVVLVDEQLLEPHLDRRLRSAPGTVRTPRRARRAPSR